MRSARAPRRHAEGAPSALVRRVPTRSAALLASLLAALSPRLARSTDGDTRGLYVHLLGTSLVGTGLRFNNPYRLATPLGASGESLSRTALYVDEGVAALFGDPWGLEHGVALRASFAIEGVAQTVVTPSYILWHRRRALAAFARAGLPVVLSPDKNVGFELAGGGVFFLRGGLGVTSELVGNLFYGAATRDNPAPVYPVLSAQLGVVVSYEAMP